MTEAVTDSTISRLRRSAHIGNDGWLGVARAALQRSRYALAVSLKIRHDATVSASRPEVGDRSITRVFLL
jgi:hypothetical protein